ncbi:hypothetical protein K431DRAFT_324111 [Polychaeton citri CBS 116435]|uniref:Uncharacterized protein n=1 Tax=Polychaeton citri CBS 116435 TaxID=1314669 RepID=A0A9P4Q0S9_9PEZI|nr:hypothetical protein K431DRAFT_324111 [Polychaeton citri CBS 116435]
MCQYTYSYYYCGCDYYIWADSIEYCANRYLSGYSVDVWTIDMCNKKEMQCAGISKYYCGECSEDHTLEFQLEE